MFKFFINDSQINENKIKIVGTDVNHISNVLRLRKNEEICICSVESKKNYISKIIDENKEYIECEIIEEFNPICESNVQISIFQGLPKADKMELIIQKSTELGAYDFTPVEMERCIVKLNNKDADKKIERWQKIAEVAAKQSKRDIIPNINNIIKIKNLYKLFEKYDIVLVAYENEKNTTLKHELKNIKKQENYKIAILIGQEGGIDIKEIEQLKEMGARIVTLGKRILRTETVALAMTSIILYELENN